MLLNVFCDDISYILYLVIFLFYDCFGVFFDNRCFYCGFILEILFMDFWVFLRFILVKYEKNKILKYVNWMIDLFVCIILND